MIAIQSKFYGPTNTRGARIKVWSRPDMPTKFYSYDYSSDEPHEACIIKYCQERDWPAEALVFGSTDVGVVGVFASKEARERLS